MGRMFSITGLVMIWASVIVISYGAHLEGVGGPDEPLPNFEWLFAFFFSGFFASLFTAGLLVIRVLNRLHRDLALLGAGAFGVGCLVGMALWIVQAIHYVRPGSGVLRMGFLLSAVGLAAGAVGIVWSLLLVDSHVDNPPRFWD